MRKFYKNAVAIVIFTLGVAFVTKAQITYDQSFDLGIAGWSTNWSTTMNQTCDGNSVRKNIYSNLTAEAFLSPNLGPNTGGAQALSFEYKIVDWSAATNPTPVNFGSIEVQYATAVAGPWITIHVINQNNHIPSATCATVVTPEFCAPAGDFYLRFNCIYGTGDYYTYFDNINLSPGTPQCFAPLGLTSTSITGSAATFTWTEGCSESAWNVELGATGFTPGTGTSIFSNNVAVTTETVTGLSELTNYDFYVQADCGGGDLSSWSGPFSFLTPSNPITNFPYLEDFETGAIAWTTGGNNNSWQIGTPAAPIINAAANGTGAAVTNLTGNYNSSELSYLYSPIFDFSTVTYPVLTFNFARQFENCCDRGWVEYSLNGTTWTKLGTTTTWNSNGYNNVGNYWSSNLTTWTETSHDLLMLNGESTVSFRFVMSSDGSVNFEGMAVDDFMLEDILCPNPTNLDVTAFDNESSTVTWGAGFNETDWNVEIGAAGFTPGIGAAIQATTVSTTSETFSGLNQSSNYEIYVQADCGGEFSTWVGPVSFTTLPNCSALTNFDATVSAPDEVELTWTPGLGGETEWYVEYGAPGFTPGTGTGSVVITNPSTTITGLTQNTTYSFYVRGVCSIQDSSSWVGPETVTTPLFCNNVSNLSAATIVDTAFLSWTAGINGETEWNVEYGFLGFTLGTGTQYSTTNNNTDTLVGLSPSGVYHYYVQASCASGDTSLFTGPFTFTMPLGNDDACDAIELPVDGTTRVYNSNGSTSQGLPGENRSVWFYFEHPNSNGVNASLCGINAFDTKIYAYTYTDCNDISTFTQIAFNDDFCGLISEIDVCGIPGEEIAIMVTGFGATASGNFSITLTEINLNAGTSGIADVCSTDMIDLNTVASISNTSGSWIFNANPNALVNDSVLNLALLPSGLYTATYFVTEGCAIDSVTAVITSVNAPQSGVAVSPFKFCNNGSVYLPDGLTGTVQSGGEWSDDSGTGLLAGQNGNVFLASGHPAGSYPFTYTVDGGVCPDASTTVIVDLEICASLDENSISYSIYPNPNNGRFNVILNVSDNAEIKVMDLQGKIVYDNNITFYAGIANEININNIVSGMYIVKITLNDNVVSSTFVVQ